MSSLFDHDEKFSLSPYHSYRAHPYGTPTILSSYSFSDTDAGSPNSGKIISIYNFVFSNLTHVYLKALDPVLQMVDPMAGRLTLH